MKINQLIKNIQELTKTKQGRIILGAIGAIIVIIIMVIFFMTRRYSYSNIEEKLVSAAKSYYKAHTKELPQADNQTVTINSDKLTKNGYIKELEKLSKNKNDNCVGQVTVYKNDDNLYYSANLSCKNYKTKKLKDVILENVVTESDGLYQVGNDFVFRGEKVNNYISINDKLWRILRVNQDGTIRVIETEKRDIIQWDNRYNSDAQYNGGINDYKVSRIKDNLENVYESLTDKATIYMTKQNLCIGKRSDEETINDGSIECADIYEGQNLGLIQANEYALASLSDKCVNPMQQECGNYNWLKNIYTWTITANNSRTTKVYKLVEKTVRTDASNTSQFKAVAQLNSQLTYLSGNGTETNPYKFK